MNGIRSRIRRLENRFGPSPDDPLGLRGLDYGESLAFDRLIRAWRDGADVTAIEAELMPSTVRKFEIIIGRAQRIEARAP